MKEVTFYILDQNFQTQVWVNTFESLLWIERYNTYGDFEIYAYPSETLLKYAVKNNYIWKSDSEYLMIIEELELVSDVEQGVKFIIRGRSLESILDRRIVWNQTRVRGDIQTCIKKLITDAIISPILSVRRIPNFIFQDTTDPFITTTQIDKQYTGDNLLDIIIEICEENGIGFKISLNDNDQLVFSLYNGTDRSYSQEVNPYVIFSPKYANLMNSNYFESIQQYKNVVLVAGEGEEEDRKTRTIGSTSGLLRRELYADARDLSSTLNLVNLINLNFSPVTNYGVTISNGGEGKVVISGTPTTTSGFNIQVNIATIPSITRGKYRISGGPKSYNNVYNSILNVSNVGSSHDGEDAEFTVNSTINNLTVSLSIYINYSSDPQEIREEYSIPKFEMYALHDIDYNNILDSRGYEKLAEVDFLEYFEGEIDTDRLFFYKEDFYMGDIVQVANEFDMEGKARIVEFISSYDKEGIKNYPTFKIIQEED